MLSQADLMASAAAHGVHPIVHLEPFYGNPADAPARPPVFAGLEFRVPVDSIATLPPFGCGAESSAPSRLEQMARNETQQVMLALRLLLRICHALCMLRTACMHMLASAHSPTVKQ